MSREDKPFRRKSALLSFRFLATAVVGSVLMGLVAAFGPQNAQLAVLGCFIGVVGGLAVRHPRSAECCGKFKTAEAGGAG